MATRGRRPAGSGTREAIVEEAKRQFGARGYRDVTLRVVNKNHLALDYLGGPGVQITPTVNGSNAGSASKASANGANPASRAICALVRRLGL